MEALSIITVSGKRTLILNLPFDLEATRGSKLFKTRQDVGYRH